MAGRFDAQKLYALITDFYDLVMLDAIEMMPDGLLKNLTFHEAHTIESVGDHPGRTLSDLAGHLGVTTSTVSTMIEKLVKRGFVKRRRGTSDRRVVALYLTGKGERVYAAHRDLHRQVGEKLLALMDEDEKRFVFGLYEKFIQAMTNGEAAAIEEVE
jgi:DNA-binding MarR family transcriptional regulator